MIRPDICKHYRPKRGDARAVSTGLPGACVIYKRGREVAVGDVLLLWCGAKRVSRIEPYHRRADWVPDGTRIAHWRRGPGEPDGGITVFPDEDFEIV